MRRSCIETVLAGPADGHRYPITIEQLNELVAKLGRGKSLTLWIANKSGRDAEVSFGGRWGKPVAAMFAACRKARFQ